MGTAPRSARKCQWFLANMLKKLSARSARRWQKQKWWKVLNCNFNHFTWWRLLIEIKFLGSVPQSMMRPAPLHTDLSVPTHSSVAHNIHRTALHRGIQAYIYINTVFCVRFLIACIFICLQVWRKVCAGTKPEVQKAEEVCEDPSH